MQSIRGTMIMGNYGILRVAYCTACTSGTNNTKRLLKHDFTLHKTMYLNTLEELDTDCANQMKDEINAYS